MKGRFDLIKINLFKAYQYKHIVYSWKEQKYEYLQRLHQS